MNNELLAVLITKYHKDFVKIKLIRDWIGKVYLVEDDKNKYVLKVFKKFNTDSAIQSADIMNFMNREGFSVPRVYLTSLNEEYFYYEGKVCVLYDYVDGGEIQKDDCMQDIGEFAAMMHKKMQL